MNTSEDCVLALNSGSSSLKFAVYARQAGSIREVERGGIAGLLTSQATLSLAGSKEKRPVAAITVEDGLLGLVDHLKGVIDVSSVRAVAHRIVHGGDIGPGAVRLDDSILRRLQQVAELAPLHLPRSLELIEASGRIAPGALQCAVFDTSFHASIPPVAKTLPFSPQIRELAVKRYGFHGLSFTFSVRELSRLESDLSKRHRVIIAHLGSGCSVAAIRDGHSVDTTMSFSPLGGVMMATRCGDIDPGIILYLARSKKMPLEQLVAELMTRSGLVGIGGTNDMRELLARRAKGDEAAKLAVEMFTYRIAQQIGAYAVTLGGLDTLIFTGGIGENSAEVRSIVCQQLGFLGVSLDATGNNAGSSLISSDSSTVRVRVIRADEERVLADEAFKLL